MTRAKFICNSVTQHVGGHSSIVLYPVLATNAEDKKFWESTPSGKIELQVVNPKAAAQFVPGTSYYVDFSEVCPE